MEEIKEVNIDDIKLDKNQPRKTFDAEKLKENSETFKTQGVIEPIEIDENNVIITGELRYRASKLAGLKTIPCKIVKGLTAEQRLERQLVENFDRQDMRLVDSIPAVKKFIKQEYGEKQKYPYENIMNDVAKRLGINRSWLYENLKLDAEGPEELKKAVKEEKISVSQATEIMKLPDKKDREDLSKSVLKEAEVPEYRKIREKVQFIKKSPKDVKKALLSDEISISQAKDLTKISSPKAREEAIEEVKQHKKIADIIPKQRTNANPELSDAVKNKLNSVQKVIFKYLYEARVSLIKSDKNLKEANKMLTQLMEKQFEYGLSDKILSTTTAQMKQIADSISNFNIQSERYEELKDLFIERIEKKDEL